MNIPVRRSHFLPRTRDGWIAVVAFAALFVPAMPPVTHTLLNRTEPWIAGLPFIFVVLLTVYAALIGVLIWTFRRGV